MQQLASTVLSVAGKGRILSYSACETGATQTMKTNQMAELKQ